jgi:hypothetical protein
MEKSRYRLNVALLLAAFLVLFAGPFAPVEAEGQLSPNQEGLVAFKQIVSSDPALQQTLLNGTKSQILGILYSYFDLSDRPMVQKRLEEMPDARLKEIVTRFVTLQPSKASRAQSRELFRPAASNG